MAISNFYNSSTLQDSQLDSCIPRAAGSVPPGNASCDDIAFSLSVETFGQVFGMHKYRYRLEYGNGVIAL